MIKRIFEAFDAQYRPTAEDQRPHIQEPLNGSDISSNPLRPQLLKDYIGQARAKEMLQLKIKSCHLTGDQFPHTAIYAGGGKGKTALIHCIANELGYHTETLAAPVHVQDLIRVGQTAAIYYNTGVRTLLLIDEIHKQTKGKSADNDPETLYHLLEDGMIDTDQGYLRVPGLTIIGATTHEGALPNSFRDRFDKVELDDYTNEESAQIVSMNAMKLGLGITEEATEMIARAAGGNPRKVNEIVKHAKSIIAALGKDSIDAELAQMTLGHKRIESDGVTSDQLDFLQKLFRQRKFNKAQDCWVAKASLNTMAQLMKRPGDTAYISEIIEPLLLEREYVIRAHQGRQITDAGLGRIGACWPEKPEAS